MNAHKIRKPAWAGQFYPEHPGHLTDTLQRYLDQASVIETLDPVVAIIAPHAGYPYSGPTAAQAYKQLEGKSYRNVIVLAPSHAESFPGASVFDGDAYETPLGRITVNQEIASRLTEGSDDLYLSEMGHHTRGHRAEHSLEVQLPFLQMVLEPDFDIVPTVIHDYRLETLQAIGTRLARVLDDNTLIIASSDLYHGYSYEDCRQMDSRTLAAIEAFDPESFVQGIADGSFQACGAGPIAALMVAVREKWTPHVNIVSQTNSADASSIQGGWTVGYGAVVISHS